MVRERVDVLMVDRKLAESRSQAQRLVMAGQVRVNGEVVYKPSVKVDEGALIEVDHGPPYVSRGGEKLEYALRIFEPDIAGLICADVGASTGGFTDCLLQHGAAKVYAIDVGQGILHWKLRRDSRVVVMENTNARYVESLSEPINLVTVDASFISLKILLPVICKWFSPGGGEVIALIKPQFEAGRKEVSRGHGVIRDRATHQRVLQEVLSYTQGIGYGVRGLITSPLIGPKGNREFLAWLEYPGETLADIASFVAAVVGA